MISVMSWWVGAVMLRKKRTDSGVLPVGEAAMAPTGGQTCRRLCMISASAAAGGRVEAKT